MKSYTILTEPLIEPSRDNTKQLFTKLKNRALRIFNYYLFKKYGGHNAVTRSLVVGLRNFGVATRLNPLIIIKKIEFCHVMADSKALLQAIELKKRGKIKFLIAGPNIAVRSNEYNSILARQEIDICLVPSQWVKKGYIEDEPSLKARITIWAAGIDEKFWIPGSKIIRNKVLIYYKTGKRSLLRNSEATVRKCGLIPVSIVYGQYNIHSYKNFLSECLFLIYISESESQGIALAESWSMNVPTLVWHSKRNKIINGKLFRDVSPAPYLNSNVGNFWSTYKDLAALLNLKKRYEPRSWVLKNMTDKISVKNLIEITTNFSGVKL